MRSGTGQESRNEHFTEQPKDPSRQHYFWPSKRIRLGLRDRHRQYSQLWLGKLSTLWHLEPGEMARPRIKFRRNNPAYQEAMALKIVSLANKGSSWIGVRHGLWAEHKTKMSIIVTHSFWWLQKGLVPVPYLAKQIKSSKTYAKEKFSMTSQPVYLAIADHYCNSNQITMSTFIHVQLLGMLDTRTWKA